MVLLVHGLLREHDRAVLERIDTGSVHPRTVAAAGAGGRGLGGPRARAHRPTTPSRTWTCSSRSPPTSRSCRCRWGRRRPTTTPSARRCSRPAADQLEQQLAAVADLVELRLDLAFDTDAVVADIARGDPEIARLAARSRRRGAGFCRADGPRRGGGRPVADTEAVAGRGVDRGAGRASPSAPSSCTATSRCGGPRTWCAGTASPTPTPPSRGCGRPRPGVADVEYVGPLPVYSFLDDLPPGPEPEPRVPLGVVNAQTSSERGPTPHGRRRTRAPEEECSDREPPDRTPSGC